MSELLLFLEAAPEVIKLVRELYIFSQGNPTRSKEFLNQLSEAVKSINQSQSHQERQNAAKMVTDLIHNGP